MRALLVWHWRVLAVNRWPLFFDEEHRACRKAPGAQKEDLLPANAESLLLACGARHEGSGMDSVCRGDSAGGLQTRGLQLTVTRSTPQRDKELSAFEFARTVDAVAMGRGRGPVVIVAVAVVVEGNQLSQPAEVGREDGVVWLFLSSKHALLQAQFVGQRKQKTKRKESGAAGRYREKGEKWKRQNKRRPATKQSTTGRQQRAPSQQENLGRGEGKLGRAATVGPLGQCGRFCRFLGPCCKNPGCTGTVRRERLKSILVGASGVLERRIRIAKFQIHILTD
ncbi:hypothetical protein QBC40DRAFT_296249 [Triangularia verruculosa]|uniref:Uncharacterized protein n=1 Tax=Triangularia verruculosa TaxID=2587418 RepID=A0AAN6XKF2_9PEZI|nr:hypothetical protein QBC40DRAFT_296249 [Triangularia verruculosa]